MKLIENELLRINVQIIEIKLGYIFFRFDTDTTAYENVKACINQLGFEIIVSREQKLVEQIKTAVIELIHYMNNVNSIVQKSEYLVEKLNMNYRYLSRLFSKYEAVTLEKFVILNKIERIKHMIDEEEYSLSEIAYMMDYSSVQYLSNQFKKETGMSVTAYKQSDRNSKKALEELY